MRKRKFFLCIVLLLLFVVGCSKGVRSGDENIDYFRADIAKEKALEYMGRLQNGDFEGAKDILSPELASKFDFKIGKGLSIASFIPGMVTETGNSVYIEIYVAKVNKEKPRCDLDKYILKVSNIKGNEYKIEEINSSNVKEIFVRGEELRMITADTGSSDVILRMKDLPVEIFPKQDEIGIQKDNVPKNKFESLGISYSGGRIAFSTTNGKDSFLGLALIEDANVTMGKVYSGKEIAEESTIDEDSLKKVFEKPLAQKIIGYDILKDIQIKEMFFTEEENELLVQYSKRGGESLGLKIYKNPDGTPSKIDLESIFPLDKYSVKFFDEIKSYIIINVDKAKGAKDISQELLGQYIIDVTEDTIDKI